MAVSKASLLLLMLNAASALVPNQPGRLSITKPSTSKKTTANAVAIPFPNVETSGAFGTTLAKEDQWIANLDYEGFGKEVAELGKRIQRQGGQDDVDHLNKIVGWRDAAAWVGIATMWLNPNPLTILALSTWTYASWTMIAHHTCHGGYNRVDAGKFNSRGFALGTVQRRVVDWLDWMMPEAWNVEHNRQHHYRLNEGADPDLVQRNLEFLREEKVPRAIKYGLVGVLVAVWKWYYYAPNTYKELQIAKWKQEGKTLPDGLDPQEPVTVVSLLKPGKKEDLMRQVVNPFDFFKTVMAPMFIFRYLLLPAPLLAVPGAGPTLFAHAVVNLALAELVTNTHSFITIVTNHCGPDMYTFDDAVKPKTPSFYVRQIVGSANYAMGTDAIDFSHGWLNYQIEHHVWPDFSMLQYQKAAPELQKICKKYGVPYVKESVFERLRKTVDIMVGKSSMRPFPTEYEPVKDKAGTAGVTWKTTNGAIDEE